jgi:phenylpyruvate tautomerase PptA (4-oxalocrotonate tautomerase family)
MTAALIESTPSAPTLRERALARAAEVEASIRAGREARRAEEALRRIQDVIRAAERHLGVDPQTVAVVEHEIPMINYAIVEYRATVDGLTFTLRPEDDFCLLVECTRGCGKDLWVRIESLHALGVELSAEHEHHFACLQQFDDEGETTTDRAGNPLPPRGPWSDPPRKVTAEERARATIASLDRAANWCASTHNRVSELEDERSVIKPEAIKRIMEQGLASSNSAAEKIVEQDPFYAEHRSKQRNAETERWASLAAWEAAKQATRLDVFLASAVALGAVE